MLTVRQLGSDGLREFDERSAPTLILGCDSKQVVLTFEQVGDLDGERVLVELGRLRPHVHHAVAFLDDVADNRRTSVVLGSGPRQRNIVHVVLHHRQFAGRERRIWNMTAVNKCCKTVLKSNSFDVIIRLNNQIRRPEKVK